MKHLQILKIFTIAFLVLLTTTSCSKDEMDSNDQLAAISVSLKSTEGDLNAVFLDLEDVQVRVKEDGTAPNAWMSLNAINTGIQNVSDLKNDSELLLVDSFEIEPAYIYEIRLVLGDNSFMDINQILVSLDVVEKGNTTASNVVKSEVQGNHIYDVSINLNLDESIWFDEDENMMILNPKIYTEIRQIEY
ncbi:DUF4382 domain-containing protein [Winogradskyella psychrotolerans]|uniref:DUF4382 domain-containing protein n=1 Tax=Winogradskyella psychrotolerans TaxID=1344585 RepID=UPI001C076218|nr:DUF4382 domain-containing protein [Winogradskyella psychrotolerans]MBU2928144.1 DUF4382 domain-containing protein [Winogradskyella psychrotolerans]